jgi:hypothetical protein
MDARTAVDPVAAAQQLDGFAAELLALRRGLGHFWTSFLPAQTGQPSGVHETG